MSERRPSECGSGVMARESKAQQRYRQLVLEHTEALVASGEVALHDLEGEEYLHRPDQLLVQQAALPDLMSALEAVGAQEVVDEEVGVARVLLAAGTDVHDAVLSVRKQAGVGSGEVGPHHVLFGAPRWHACPGRPPSLGTPLDLGQLEGADGEGVLIAVLDTGLAQAALSGTWESAHVVSAEIDALDTDNDAVLDLVAGHGTFVTGVIAQVAPGAKVLALAPLQPNGLTDDVTAASAVLAARAAGAAVLNLSFGGYGEGDAPPMALATVLAQAKDDDDAPVVVAAAGNDGLSRRFWPAALPGVVAVAALSSTGRRAGFSNYGPWVEACADGDRLLSTFVTGEVMTDSDGDGDRDVFVVPTAHWSGTSFAAPQVAAAVAVRMAATGETARQALAELLHGPGVTRRPGLGAHVPTPLRSNAAAPGRP